MPSDLTVRFTIPVQDEFGTGSLLFTKWVPLGEDYVITSAKEDLLLRLWFDSACVHSLTAEEVARYSSVGARFFYVDVVIPRVPDKLADFIYQEGADSARHPSQTPNDEVYQTLSGEFLELGTRALTAAVDFANRLNLYARNQKGQYWHEPLKIRPGAVQSLSNHLRAMVKVQSYEWVKWNPPDTSTFTLPALG